MALPLALAGSAVAQTAAFDVHDFGGFVQNADHNPGQDGYTITSGPTTDSQGNVYGVTQMGGAYGLGMLWEYTTTGNYVDLYDFGGDLSESALGLVPGAYFPCGTPAVDTNGAIYGTTAFGGGGSGTVWKFTPAQGLTVLHSFGGMVSYVFGGVSPDGNACNSNLISLNGAVFGTTSFGGQFGQGTLWGLASDGSQYGLFRSFGDPFTFNNELGASGSDGIQPAGSIGFDPIQSQIFGTTSFGGSHTTPRGSTGGTIWSFDFSGKYTVIHNFGANGDGFLPSGVTVVSNCDFIGVLGTTQQSTNSGGALSGGQVYGNINGTYFSIYDFGGGPNAFPNGAPILTNDGTLYGTTGNGGSIWRLKSRGTLEFLVNGLGGPIGQMAMTPRGDIFTTASFGGANGRGSLVALSSLLVSVAPNPLLAGTFGTGTVTLAVVSTAPVTVTLTSESADLNVPCTITIPAGSRTGTFPVSAAQGSPAEVDLIHASAPGQGTATIGVQVTPFFASLTVNPMYVGAGASTTGTLTLSSTYPIDTVVPMNSNKAFVGVPATVTVPAGSSSVSFPITTSGNVPLSTNIVFITALLDHAVISQNVFVVKVSPASLSFSPNFGPGGVPVQGTVTLTAPAPAGGIVVSLASDSAYAKVPSAVTVPAGASSGTFTLTTLPVSTDTTANILARSLAGNITTTFTVQPPQVVAVQMPSSLIGGTSGVGTVILNGPTSKTGLVVNLTGAPNISMPSSITAPAGATSANFNYTTTPVGAPTPEQIVASDFRGFVPFNILVQPLALTLTFDSSTLAAGSSMQGTVTIPAPAPTSGYAVVLQSSGGAAKVPASIVIPAGSTSASFTVTTTKVTSSVTISVKARISSASTTTSFTLHP